MAPQSENSEEVVSVSSTLTNARGLRLFTKYWEPVGKIRALVFISHGFAEHCLPYENLARELALRKFYVFSHDHVGHGQSEGQRASIDSFDRYVEDVFLHVDLIRKKHLELDCFICGHSMGGAISILSALQKPQYFKGVILIGPCIIANPEQATPFKIAMAKMLRWIAPQFPIGRLDLSLVCRCPKQVKLMEQDPLRFHGFGKAAFGASLIDACTEIQLKIPSISFPFLLCQGEEDKLCTPEGAVCMYEKSTSSDKSIKMYPKAYHNLLVEPDGIAKQLTSDIIEWITARA